PQARTITPHAASTAACPERRPSGPPYSVQSPAVGDSGPGLTPRHRRRSTRVIHSTRQAETEHDLRVRQEADYLRQIAERALDGAKATVSMLEDVVASAQRLDQ